MEINLQWEQLTRIPLPEGQHPKTCPPWGLPRKDGRNVSLQSMHQRYLYSGDLSGGVYQPGHYLQSALTKASDLFPWVAAPPVVIPPVLPEYPLPTLRGTPPPGHVGPVTLPRVMVIAELSSYKPAHDAGECFSTLVVIWFQDQFGDTPLEIQQRIAELDWNALAYDWTP